MCRLYGLHASHPTRAACELLDAQNALIRQSREDARGLSNPHGWGMGCVVEGSTSCFRQVRPASESAAYRREALQAEGTTVLAHVRRATVGDPKHVNTHPFRHKTALLIHNGHIPHFDAVRPLLLDRLDAGRRAAIQGSTDSEHVFALLRQLHAESPSESVQTVTRTALRLIQTWVASETPTATVEAIRDDAREISHDRLKRVLGLNLLWTDGQTLGGARLNRTLWAVQREQVHRCARCNRDHARPPEGEAYRSTTLASERLTDENWTTIPNGSVFQVQPTGALRIGAISG